MALAEEEPAAGERALRAAQCGRRRHAWLLARAWLPHEERSVTTAESRRLA